MLRVWKTDPYSGTPLSQDGVFTNPLYFKVPPAGGVEEVQLWLRHDELSGELAESSYNIDLDIDDDFGTDNSSWIEIAEDISGTPGTYGSTLAVGDLLVGQIYSFWLKATVPDTGQVGAIQDIYLKLNADSTPNVRPVNLSAGEFTRCEYTESEDAIVFDVEEVTGEWYSDWIDISQVNDISYINRTIEGQYVRLMYRTSSDGTEENAQSWVTDVDDIDLMDDFIQFKVEFQTHENVGQIGLIRRIYGGTEFNTYKNITVGAQMPSSSTPGDAFSAPKSVKWGGWFYASETGSYKFSTTSNDGHRFYINGELLHESWTTTSGSNTVNSFGSVVLAEGWHEVEWHYYHSDGDDTISTFVDPPSTANRAIALTDFSPTEMELKISNLVFAYLGQRTYHFDIQIFDGPDVPELIDPPNGTEYQIFSPELTVYQRNSQYIEFQFDNETTFASPYMVSWIVDTIDFGGFENEVTSAPPNALRPPGIWYWRARGSYNGAVSEWSDYRYLELLPLVTNDECLYVNANVGFKVIDPIEGSRFLYVNVNVGLPVHDPIEDHRFLYENVNIDTAIGKVIYPIYDDTRTRKEEFETDDAFLDRT